MFRVDLAKVEHDFPLSRADRMKITPEALAALSQEQIDQIYGRLTAGPIPDGQYLGDLFFARGENLRSRLEEIVGGIEGRVISVNIGLLENVGRMIWKGKDIKRDQRILRNMIDDFAVLDLVVDNPDSVPKTTIPRDGRFAVSFRRDEVFLLFPGKDLLRTEPLGCAARVGHRRLRLQRRDRRLSQKPGFARRPRRPAHSRRNPHGAARPLSRPRLCEPLVPAELHALQRRRRRRDGPAFARGDAIAEDCWPGEQRRIAVR